MTEKYAKPGIYRDDDDHGQLIDENRLAYMREEADRKRSRLRDIEQALDSVETQDAIEALQREKEQLEKRLEWLADEIEAEQP